MILEEGLVRARSGRNDAEQQLFAELRIPSVSADPDRRGDMERMRNLLVDHVTGIGFDVRLSDAGEDTEPVIDAQWLGAGPDAPLLTIYGHYDVQPAGPLEAWHTDPFVPKLRDGVVYGRGSADNKGNHVAALKAAEYAIAGGSPVNFRFLFDGQEEIWGPEFNRYVEANASRLRSDYSLLWDSSFSSDGRPLLVSAMRGIVTAQIDVRGPGKDTHSGTYGGVTPNPANALARILAGLKTEDGRIDIPGFYDGVADPESNETDDWDRSAEHEQRLRDAIGVPALDVAAGATPLEALWCRPTLDVSGLNSGYTGPGAMGIVPSWAMAKVGMRLVIDQDPDAVFDAFRRRVLELAPATVDVEVTRLGRAHPARLSYQGRGALALRSAFKAAFGIPASIQRIGGGMQPASAFIRFIGGEVLSSGANQPAPGAHAPNEHLDLSYFHRGTETLLRFIQAIGEP